jgi:hypothetical protein
MSNNNRGLIANVSTTIKSPIARVWEVLVIPAEGTCQKMVDTD